MYFITTKRMLEVCFSVHPNIQYRTVIFYWIKGQYYLNLKYINGKWMTILTGRGYFVDKGTK